MFRRDRPAVPKSYQFLEFKRRVISNAFLCRDFRELVVMSEFGRYVGIEEGEFWGRLEEKFGQLLSRQQGNIPAAIDVMLNFSLRGKGEDIYHKLLQNMRLNVDTVSADNLARALYGFFAVRKGDQESIVVLLRSIIGKLDGSRKETTLILMMIFREFSGITKEMFQAL